MTRSTIAAGDPPARHIRSEKEFIEKALSPGRPELAAVRDALEAKGPDAAWKALLSHFEKRKAPADPEVARWAAHALSAKKKDSVLQALARRECVAEFREKGAVDWEHGKNPPRKDWEKFWSRNRLAFLAEFASLANAGDVANLRELTSGLFLDWFRRCPPPALPVKSWYDRKTDGFAWREIEVGIRGRNLVSLFLATRRWKDVPGEFHRSLLIAIQHDMDYLASHFAKIGPTKGNHQAHHAPAFVAAGALLPELDGASRWKALGLRILREHLKLDHDEEGVQKEHSPSYHLGVTALYLDPFEVLTKNGEKAPKWMTDALGSMVDFVLHSTAPDGRLVTLNDCFPNRSEALRKRAADALVRPDLLAVESGATGDLPPTGRAFKTAGIAFMRSSWRKDAAYVVLDASGFGSSHWHAGKPNLVIHAGGQILACDPQLASYDDPSFWKYFHTAQGHNTVIVDGEGDGTPVDFWRFKDIPAPNLTFFESAEKSDVAKATTDGYRRLKPPVDLERTVEFVKPDLIFVRDVLRSKGEHTYEWLLHLVPQEPVVDRKARSLTTALGGPFELHCAPTPGTAAAISGFAVRQGKYRNLTYGMSEGRGEHWTPPEEGGKPALLVDAPYGVWKQTGKGEIVFEFALRILRRGETPGSVERAAP